jgi:hypothetical protein
MHHEEHDRDESKFLPVLNGVNILNAWNGLTDSFFAPFAALGSLRLNVR